MRTPIGKVGIAVILVLGLALASAVRAGEEEPKGAPDATVKLSGGTVSIGIGYTWGGGVLTFKGKEYKFKIDGLTTTALGASSIDASGDVYHLANAKDFAGSFVGVTTAAGMGGGVGFSNMKNGNGVFVQLHSTGTGVLFKAGPSGITVTME